MILDRDQRQQAVMTSGHAFVQASAGTGKTHTLTLRALYLLLTAPFDKRTAHTDTALLYSSTIRAERLRAARAVMRRFVLTTFTRKAAAEMQTRLYEYLDAIASAPDFREFEKQVKKSNGGRGDEQFLDVVKNVLTRGVEFEQLRGGTEALAELANELQVCTLHSFAAAILRRHPIAAGIPPTARFAEEEDTTAPDVAALLIERWWQYVLADDALQKALAKLIEVVPLADMNSWLNAIYKDRWIADEMNFPSPNEKEVRKLVSVCEALSAGLIGARGNAKNVIRAGEMLASINRKIEKSVSGAWTEMCSFWEENCDVLFGAKRSQAAANAIAKLGEHSAWFDNYERIYTMTLQKCLAADHAETWQRWQAFVARFAEWIEDAAVRELGIVTFDDMIRIAAKLLGTHKDVREEERRRLSAILVDEFQDTDPTQLDLLELLLCRDSKDDHEVIGFFVGDSKQSIYRFRGADLPAIEKFISNYTTMVKAAKGAVHEFRLTTNFRSLPTITDCVNQLFQNSIPLPHYEQDKLTPARTEKGVPPEWRVIQENPDAKSAEEKREFAAWETARLIEAYKNETKRGDSAYGDIVVLVNTHSEMDVLLPVLQQCGIPVVSSGAKTFYRQPEVLDTLNLLIALYHPQDSLAVAALLRSPMIGCSDEDICRLLNEVWPHELFHGTKHLPNWLSAETRARIETLRDLITRRAEWPLAQWLQMARQFIPVGVYAHHDTEGRTTVRIDNVFSAFRNVLELGSIPPLVWLLEQRARADRSDSFDADLGEDVSITDESMAAVRAMTIHKAKGLQGKYVIVCGWQTTLDKQSPKNRGEKKPIGLTDHNGNIVRGYALPWGELSIVSPQWFTAVALNEDFEIEEAKRLAYVAVTRAQDRLVLLSPTDKEIADGLLADARDVLESGKNIATVFDDTLQVALVEPKSGESGTRTLSFPIRNIKSYTELWRERYAESAKPIPTLLHKPSQPEWAEEQDVADEADYVPLKIREATEVARLAGTVVHRFLERHLLDARFEEIKLAAVVSLMTSDVLTLDAIEKARVALSKFFGSERHRRALESKILGRETPVFLVHDDKLWSGIMDLVMEEDGAVVGVDYKVLHPPAALPAEYKQQKKIYTEALRRLFPGKKVRFEFWWFES